MFTTPWRDLLLLEHHVNLAAGLKYFPGALEACRNDESVTCTQRLRIAGLVTQHRYAVDDLAVLMFGVTHRPLADRAFSHARCKLTAWA